VTGSGPAPHGPDPHRLLKNVRGQVTWSRVAMLYRWEASLSSCGPVAKSRTLGLWLTPHPLGL